MATISRRTLTTAALTMASLVAASTCAQCLRPARSAEAPAPPAPPAPDARFPGIRAGIAEGWPIVLRGAVTGTPVAADLDGDGRLEVIAPAMQRSWDRGLASPDPTIAAQLWALRADGTSLDGWPLTLKTVEERQNARKNLGGGTSENWYVSPSVCDVDGDGRAEIVINTGGHNALDAARANIAVLYGDGGRITLGHGADAWASIPLADINGDGVLDVVIQEIARDVRGHDLPGWPPEKRLHAIYQPTIGDADADGRPEVFVPFMSPDWSEPGSPRERTMGGYSAQGDPLPGWPIKLPTIGIYAAMGDVAGDSKKEILCVDRGGTLHIWEPDGTPVAPPGPGAAEGRLISASLSGEAPLCLADLDGDGKAEILSLDRNSRGLYAFHGDGRPFATLTADDATAAPELGKPTPQILVRDAETGKLRALDPSIAADRKRLEKIAAGRARLFAAGPAERGLIARLPPGNAGSHCAVAAVDLGGDGVMDIFAGTQWIRLGKDGKARVTEMLPPEQQAGARNGAGCSIVDLEGDGDAEVLFGLEDGRLFVFRTGLSLAPRDAQWPTWSGNFQHTGVWTAAK